MQAEAACTEVESLTVWEIARRSKLIEKTCRQYQFYESSPLFYFLTGAQKAFFSFRFRWKI